MKTADEIHNARETADLICATLAAVKDMKRLAEATQPVLARAVELLETISNDLDVIKHRTPD